jgi:two-component system sensor histidine kinase CssS
MITFKRVSEKAKIEDLKVAHDIILKSGNGKEPDRFGDLKNLKDSEHFEVAIDNNDKVNIADLSRKESSPPSKDFSKSPPDYADKIWMAGFINGDNMYLREFRLSHKNRKFLFIISSVNSDTLGKVYLISYIPDREDMDFIYVSLIIGAAFIFIGFVASKIAAQFISRPLKELEEHTKKIARKNWDTPITINSEDEIGRLANSMNEMQKELQKSDDEEKQFLQSISHDLKTPVMVIMSHAEAIIDGVYIDSVEKTAEIIRDEAVSLQKKVKQLLYLNTLDHVLINSNETGRVNFRQLLLYIINRFETVNSKVEWDLDIDDILINGNEEKLQVAIENILDNSLRYVQEKIYISLKEEANFAVLEIYNDGPNIKKENLEYIFENLYKDKTGNFGLGLAITKKIINFYGGEIKAENKEKGVSFIIKYPIS